jgi:predicted permease
MTGTWDKMPWATIIGGAIVIIVALVGGFITAFHSETLSFKDYVDSLSNLAVGVGLVAVGRGVTKAGKHIAKDDASR